MSRSVFRTSVTAVGIILGLTAGGCGTSAETDSVSTVPPRSSVVSMPAGDGLIEPGSYRIPRSAWSAVDFDLTIPSGWYVQYGHVYGKHQDKPTELHFYAVVVGDIYTDACHGDGAPMEVGPGADDLLEALQQQLGPVVSEPVATAVGGYPATRIDLQIPETLDLEQCRLAEDGVLGLQVWYSGPADKYFVLAEDGSASVYIVDVDGDRQVFLTHHSAATSDEDLAELQAVLESIRIHA